MNFANVVKHEYISSKLGHMEQWIVDFGNGFGASILFDLKESTFEVGILENGILCYTTPIAQDVIPGLTYDEVESILEKIKALTPKDINRSMSKGQLRKAMHK